MVLNILYINADQNIHDIQINYLNELCNTCNYEISFHRRNISCKINNNILSEIQNLKKIIFKHLVIWQPTGLLVFHN
jgi:hypothetical protein